MAGLVGSFMMNAFHERVRGDANGASTKRKHKGANVTTNAADALTRKFAGRSLTAEEGHAAGVFMHYAFGAVSAAAFGLALPHDARHPTAWGIAYGVAIWLAADEIIAPAMKLSAPPWRYSARTHFASFAEHLIYGLVVGRIVAFATESNQSKALAISEVNRMGREHPGSVGNEDSIPNDLATPDREDLSSNSLSRT